MLNYQAPGKKKHSRANQAPFLTKEINKEIMTRSRLKKNLMKIKKHIMTNVTVVLRLVRSAKKAHYSNLSIKDVNNNEKFWKIVKPLFSEKVNTKENIVLIDNNNIISSEAEIAEKLSSYFRNIVKELNIKVKEDLLFYVSNINDPVERAQKSILKKSNYQPVSLLPNIRKIFERCM